MSIIIRDDRMDPVHLPRRDVFEFDEDVSQIFENMAIRSIPMYAEMHRMHARLAVEHINRRRRGNHVIVDIGASRGTFFKNVCKIGGYDMTGDPFKEHNVRMIAVDTSPYMLGHISRDLPFVETRQMKAHEIVDKLLPEIPGGADIICMHYLLQFIPRSYKDQVLRAACKCLRKNGLLLLGQKDASPEDSHKMIEDILKELYIDFRKDNGYTDQEIGTKTLALKNSMWLNSGQRLRNMVYKAGFGKIMETTRWGHFSSWVAVKTK